MQILGDRRGRQRQQLRPQGDQEVIVYRWAFSAGRLDCSFLHCIVGFSKYAGAIRRLFATARFSDAEVGR